MKIRRTLATASCVLIAVLCASYNWGFLKNKDHTLPLNILHGLPLVNVHIQGHEVELILDLGSHVSSLSSELINEIKLDKTEKTANSMDVYGKKSTNPVFSPPNVSIGNYLCSYVEFSEAESFNTEFESQTPQVLTYGKIGREPFLDKVVFIDRKRALCVVEQAYSAQKVDLEKYAPGEWMRTDFNLDAHRGIGIDLLTDPGGHKKFILDTGSNVSVISDPSSAHAPIDLRDKTQKISLKLNNGIDLGSFSFYPFDLTDVELQGILGFDFFDRYMICLDFLNEEMFLKAYPLGPP